MALAHTLGFPRIGRDRELKKAQEAFWKGELDEAGLRAVGRQLRAAHWQVQKDAGIQLLPVGDFAWYDQVLTHSLTFGVIPERFRAHGEAGPTLHTLFGMARGVSDDSCCGGAHAQEMTKWFDTNYHYLVPEFSADQQFQLSWEQLFEEVDEARALGHQVKPVLIGPLTYLWLGKGKGGGWCRASSMASASWRPVARSRWPPKRQDGSPASPSNRASRCSKGSCWCNSTTRWNRPS